MNKWLAGLKQTHATHKIIMEISLLIMEKSWNNHGIWILNFCGNPDINSQADSIHLLPELLQGENYNP